MTLIATIGLGGNIAFAQSENMITLLYEGEDGISGELLEYDGKVFKIASSVGRLTIPAGQVTCIGEACPEGVRLEPTLPMISLKGVDGSISVTGHLIDANDKEYVLATNVGEFRIAVDAVTCEGEGCPVVQGELPESGLVVLSDGDNTVEGTLIGLDGSSFVVQHELLGTLRLDRSVFTCEGSVCP